MVRARRTKVSVRNAGLTQVGAGPDALERTPSSDGKYKYDRTDLSDMVKLSFDNTTVEDIKNEVLTKEPFKLGVHGLFSALKVDPAKGISSKEQQTRTDAFGVNEIPMEPQTSIFALMSSPLPESSRSCAQHKGSAAALGSCGSSLALP